MGDESTGTFRSVIAGFSPYVITGVSVIILLGAAGLLAYQVFGGAQGAGGNETLRFISLLILFMVALGATASLFVSLRMGNPGEAFGLPSGSIRALLALGIMTLFVVFGMPVISPQSDPMQPIDARVSPAALDATVRSHRDDGFIVVVRNPGVAAVRDAAGVTTTPETLADIRIMGRLPSQSAGQLDLTKQLLTAIITLLTTVIGFYFGSRSTTDGMQQSTDGAGPATTLAELRKQVDAGLTPLKAEITQLGARVERIKALGDAAAPDARAIVAAAEPARAAIEAKRDEAGRELTAADAALAAFGSAAGADERARHEAAGREHLRKAGEAIRIVQETLPAYRDSIARL